MANCNNCIKFQSTPPSLAETYARTAIISVMAISIHSAIASGDRAPEGGWLRGGISIHSAIASGDHVATVRAMPY